MRWILVALVVANLALFTVWQTGGERTAAVTEQNPERIRVVPIERLGMPGAAVVPASACRIFVAASDDQARALRAALAGSSAEVSVQAPGPSTGHLVYLPPAPNHAEAQRRVAALRQAGFDDAFPLPDGSLRHGVSLGLFAREAGAREMAARVTALGYEVRIAPRPAGEWRLTAHWPRGSGVERGVAAAAALAARALDCP